MKRIVVLASFAAVLFAGSVPGAGAFIHRKPISLRATVLASTLTGFFAAESDGTPHLVYSNRLPATGSLVSIRAVWDGHNRFYVYASTGTSIVRTLGTRHAATVKGSVGTIDRSNHRFILMVQGQQATDISYKLSQAAALSKAAARPSSTHVLQLVLTGQRWRLVSIR